MPSTPKKPAKPAPTTPDAKPGARWQQDKAKPNPRLQADNRWQRTKRYGWDSR